MKTEMRKPPARNRVLVEGGAVGNIDPYRAILFPNALRVRRLAAGVSSLLALAERVPHIPYIRLSKIERGEVFARPEELSTLAHALDLADPADLLVDVDAPGFSLKNWVGGRMMRRDASSEAEELAMLLAAALRRLRMHNPDLTLARLQQDYRLPAVIISRIENAVKPFDRWNEETIGALCALFAVGDRSGLTDLLWGEFRSGALAEGLARIPGAEQRQARTSGRIAALREELQGMKGRQTVAVDRGVVSRRDGADRLARVPVGAAMVQVVGIPLGDGLIEPFPNPHQVALPSGSGPDSYALRMCRASLGAAIPGGAVLIVDPARVPVQGGLGVLREGAGLRVLALATDKEGRLFGHSSNPQKEIALDAVSPADLAMVTAVLFT